MQHAALNRDLGRTESIGDRFRPIGVDVGENAKQFSRATRRQCVAFHHRYQFATESISRGFVFDIDANSSWPMTAK